MGSGSKSKTTSKPVLLPEQKRIWEYFSSSIIPMAEGRDTALTRQIMQATQDTTAQARAQSEQSIVDMAGRTGMGSAQMASLLKDADRQAIEAQIKAMNAAKMSTADRGLQMIAGMPISPGTQTTTKTGGGMSPVAKMAIGAGLGAATGGLGAAAMGASAVLPSLAGAASGAGKTLE